MSDENPVLDQLAKMGGAFAIANDIDRTWATGAQTFVNKVFTMLVFREQNLLMDEEGKPREAVLKNVASVVLPTEVAVEFHKLMGEQLKAQGLVD